MPLPSQQPRKASITEPTNSEVNSSESLLQLQHNGKFVKRVIDRFRHSLVYGLLRKSETPTCMHNSKNNDDHTETKAEQAPGVSDGNQQATEPNVHDALAVGKAAEKFYTVDTEAYDLKSIIEYYRKEDTRIMPKLMKFMVGHRCRTFGSGSGGSGKGGSADDAAGCSVNYLMDKLANEFCLRMGMLEVTRRPVSDERIFLWLNRDAAHRMLREIDQRESGSQVFFVNRVNFDNLLTDLQCLCSRLSGCVARDGQVYPPHCCPDPEMIRVHREVFGGAGPLPKFIYVGRQVLCHHVYLQQDFRLPCEVKTCPNYGKRLCTCFQTDMFIPDTIVLATKQKFEEVRTSLDKKLYGKQRWLLRASNLKGGNGVQFIDTAPELETFMRYDLQKRLRGQFYVLQRYLQDPLLLDGKRVDLRMFLLVVVLTDRRVLAFLHPGYLRQAQRNYDATSNDLRCHLTWPFTWDPDYNRYKVEAASEQPASQSDYCRSYAEGCESLGLPSIVCDRSLDSAVQSDSDASAGDDGGKHFLRRLNRIVCSLASQIDSIVCDKPGSWQLFGIDLQPSADRTIWLHDVMSYPCQGEPDLRSETQNRVLPGVLTEALALVLELNQRDFATRASGSWLDLPDVPVNQPGLIAAQRNFVWLYSTDTRRLITYKPQRQRNKPPHWYHQWRVAEDSNDYILYLKNHRIATCQLSENALLYGRKSFDFSPAEKFRRVFKTSLGAEKSAPLEPEKKKTENHSE